MYRQGDVLLVRDDDANLDALALAAPDARGRLVLARGEATGHAHSVDAAFAALYEPEDEASGVHRVLVIREEICLRHEEHDPIVLPPGRYLVVRQREYGSEQAFVAD